MPGGRPPTSPTGSVMQGTPRYVKGTQKDGLLRADRAVAERDRVQQARRDGEVSPAVADRLLLDVEARAARYE